MRLWKVINKLLSFKKQYMIYTCNETRINSQTEYRLNTSVLNTIFTTANYKNRFEVFFLKVGLSRLRKFLPN